VSVDWQRRATLAASGVRAAVCTVVKTSGSTPRKVGTTMLVIDDGSEHGSIEGTIGGGAVEHRVRGCALEVIAAQQPQLLEVHLSSQLGMCCGGTMSIYIESLQQRPCLVLFGAGHVSQALAAHAHGLGFEVTVCDPRDDLRTTERFPHATLVDAYDDEDIRSLRLQPEHWVVVATHDHQQDQRIVCALLHESPRYLALIGSQRKALLTRERCRQRGHNDDVVDRIICPAGLDIGAETPAEIALSVMAQVVQRMRTSARAAKAGMGAVA
jgi:xanthine dehydrogenase accessory factor